MRAGTELYVLVSKVSSTLASNFEVDGDKISPSTFCLEHKKSMATCAVDFDASVDEPLSRSEVVRSYALKNSNATTVRARA